MPFQETVTQPDPNPDVQILFHGLLLLYPDNGACSVGVHNQSSAHELFLTVAVVGQDVPIAYVDGKLKEPFKIIVTGQTVKGVTKYVTKGAQDFNSSVDLQKLHPKDNLQIDKKHTEPGIYFNEGVLYAAALTSPNLQVTFKQGSQSAQIHDPIADPVAANIAFENRQIELTWKDKRGRRHLTLPRANTTNERYVILISNGENPAPPVPPVGQTAGGDFKEHYKVVSGVNAQDQFDIYFTSVKAKARAKAKPTSMPVTTRVPCMAVVVGG